MKVKYVGFGGNTVFHPCYEDEKGNLYFDINEGGKLPISLYTGAYRDSFGDICGEPNAQVTAEIVQCNKPFKKG